jgi:D-tyrosyl-tRNA(Tyr) deacylase
VLKRKESKANTLNTYPYMYCEICNHYFPAHALPSLGSPNLTTEIGKQEEKWRMILRKPFIINN